jgi:hypothetical protein
MRAVVTVALAAALAATACSRGSAPERAGGELDTVEVTAKPDAQASLAADAVARPVGASEGAATVLPAGFPAAVPLPSPSSLVGSATTARELRVTLAVDLPAESVVATYRRQLAAAGFAEEPDGAFAGNGVRLRFAVTPDSDAAARLTVRVARP